MIPRANPFQLITGVTFMFMGAMHFVAEKFFVAIVPKQLPNPQALVYVSGVFEFLGGLGLLIPRVRKSAGLGLLALVVAVFPANINMAVNSERFNKFPAWALWLRLPLQFVILAIVWLASQSKDEVEEPAAETV
jgi:uncharacterized membrane protein